MLKLSGSRSLHARARRRLSERLMRRPYCYLGDEQLVWAPRDRLRLPSL
jgi:hypothetical protein